MADNSRETERKPEYKHEFVALMFAVAMAEIGLQASNIVTRHDFAHDIPGISHLILAFVVVATSWVGWCKTLSPGGLHDVNRVFEGEFLILVLDVLLVILYLILIRTGGILEVSQKTTPLAGNDGFWIFAIFFGYVLWDILTKLINKKVDELLIRKYLLRFVVTLLCCFIALIVWLCTRSVDTAHTVPAHFALISIVLLFRAAKEWLSLYYPVKRLTGSQTEICLASVETGISRCGR